MKFKSDIEIQAGVEAGGSTGSNGQVLSSTGSGVAWIDQNAITSATDFVFFNVKNETGSTILKGKGVMAVGTDGNSGHILIDEMVADGTVESKYFLGVLEEDIANGAFARVISFGQLSQFNTNGQNGETWADGQVLWCDPANNGDFTITEPDGPNVKIAAAFILNSSTNGKIQIRVQANEGIHDLHDTKITSQVDGDVLVWDNTTGVWFNDSTLNVDYANGRVGIGTTAPALQSAGIGMHVSAATSSEIKFTTNTSGHTATDGTALVANGTGFTINNREAGYLSLGTNNSPRLYINSTGNVGIGTTSPDAKLHVYNAGTSFIKIDSGSAAPYMAGVEFLRSSINGGRIYNDGGAVQVKLESYYGYESANPTRGGFTFKTAPVTSGTLVDAVRIDARGYVGIGTTSPSQKLHVNGSAYISNDFWTTGDTGLWFNNNSFTAGITGRSGGDEVGIFAGSSEKMRIDSSGKVGIGTTNPGAKLDVNGSAYIGSTANNNGGSSYNLRLDALDTSSIGFHDSGSTIGAITFSAAQGGFILGANHASYGPHKVRTASDLIVDGKVGIGTTDPGQKLDVRDGTITSRDSGNVNYAELDRFAGLTLKGNGAGVKYISTPNTDDLGFKTNNAEKMRITSSGNVGIGTTDPQTKLHINRTTLGEYFRGGSGGLRELRFSTYNTASDHAGHKIDASSGNGEITLATGGSARVTVDNTGNVGIGTTDPGQKTTIVTSNESLHDVLGVYNGVTGTSALGKGAAIRIGKSIDGSYSTKIATIYEGNNPSYLQPALAFFTMNNTHLKGSEVERMRISANGNVGIGTDSPSESLEISKSANHGIKLSRPPSGLNPGDVLMQVHSGGKFNLAADSDVAFTTGTSSEGFVIKANTGSVGIGATSPQAKLDVRTTSSNYVATFKHSTASGYAPGSILLEAGQGSSRGQGIYHYNNVADENWFTGVPYNVNSKKWIVANKYSTVQAVDTAQLTYALMTIDSDTGNVGIGTASPSQKLDVNGYARATSGFVGNSGLSLFGDNSSTNRVFITTGGSVGIGTTSPSYKLHVVGGINAGGKVTYTKSYSSVDTTGNAVAGLLASYNGQSACFTFTCFGHTGGYQKIVYSCHNAVGTWNTTKAIDEGTNDFDVAASANGSTITFTFKSTSGTKSYSPKVTIEAIGSAINSTYA